MKTALLAVVVLLSACTSRPTRPRDDDREGIADYIVACINSGDVEEIDKYVVNKKEYSLVPDRCADAYIKRTPGWRSLSYCEPNQLRTLTLAAIKELPNKYGKCTRYKANDRYVQRPEGDLMEVGIECGKGSKSVLGAIELDKFIELDDSGDNALVTKYWVLNTFRMASGLNLE
jgi:hypothetical protein